MNSTTNSPENSEHTADKEHEREIAELSQKGYQLLKQGFAQEAQTYFQKILDDDSANNYALVGIGDALRKQRSFGQAAQHYEKCLKHHPSNNYALFGLADSYSAMHRYRESAEVWERYLEHDDRNITVLTRVADVHRKARDFGRAKELYENVLAIQNNNLYALIGMGHLHYDFKEYTDALGYWNRVLKLTEPREDIRILTSIGNCYRKIHKFDASLPFFERARRKDSNNFYALFGLADCFRGLNRPQDALELWARLLEREPDNKVILTRVGDAYRKLGNTVKAEQFYQSALDIEFDIYAVLGLAHIHMSNGKAADAIQSLRSVVQQDPHNHRIAIALSQAHQAANDREQAVKALEDFMQQGLRHPSVVKELNRLQHG